MAYGFTLSMEWVSVDLAKQCAFMAHEFVRAYWVYILAVVLLWFVVAFFFHTRMVRGLAGGRAVTRMEEPDLYNLLENLCISRGLSMPQLNIIETHARNAFASGLGEKTYAITVTRGLLQSLTQDEVEAVLAHELTHIINHDVRLLVISIVFVGFLGFMAQAAWRVFRHNLFGAGRYGGRGQHGKKRRDGALLLVVLAVMAVLWLGYILTVCMRFALSRRREYMADAGAVQLTKNPEAMISALQRIAGRDKIPTASSDIALMCIENSSRFFGMFATHPSIDSRIAAIADFSRISAPEVSSLPPAGSLSFQRAGRTPWH